MTKKNINNSKEFLRLFPEYGSLNVIDKKLRSVYHRICAELSIGTQKILIKGYVNMKAQKSNLIKERTTIDVYENAVQSFSDLLDLAEFELAKKEPSLDEIKKAKQTLSKLPRNEIEKIMNELLL